MDNILCKFCEYCDNICARKSFPSHLFHGLRHISMYCETPITSLINPSIKFYVNVMYVCMLLCINLVLLNRVFDILFRKMSTDGKIPLQQRWTSVYWWMQASVQASFAFPYRLYTANLKRVKSRETQNAKRKMEGWEGTAVCRS